MFGQMCEHGFLVCGLEGGGPPHWEESRSRVCGPACQGPGTARGGGPLRPVSSLCLPLGQTSLWRGGEKNHSARVLMPTLGLI